jgi:hypothetical protein
MPVPGSDRDFVLDHERALREADALGRRVVVLDAVGHIEGIGLSELLATGGREVWLAMPLPTPINLDGETLAHALPRAVRSGVDFRPATILASIGDHQVTLVDLWAGKPETVESVDHVVIRTHGLPEDALYFALEGEFETVLRVGDAVAVRPVDRAIYDGHRAGRAL